jgi:hypothetical protein
LYVCGLFASPGSELARTFALAAGNNNARVVTQKRNSYRQLSP